MYDVCMGCEDEQSGIEVDWDAQLSSLWRHKLASIGCAQAVSVTPPHILLLVLAAAFAAHFGILSHLLHTFQIDAMRKL